jgi:histidinol dehydrogenase
MSPVSAIAQATPSGAFPSPARRSSHVIAAGRSHVLPTGGTARWASGLSANDFLKRSSLIAVTREGLRRLAPDVRRLADIEGLGAHRLSVDIRLSESQHP